MGEGRGQRRKSSLVFDRQKKTGRRPGRVTLGLALDLQPSIVQTQNFGDQG